MGIAALAESGFLIKAIKTHYQDGSNLSGHVSHKNIPVLSYQLVLHGLSVGVDLFFLLNLIKEKQSCGIIKRWRNAMKDLIGSNNVFSTS